MCLYAAQWRGKPTTPSRIGEMNSHPRVGRLRWRGIDAKMTLRVPEEPARRAWSSSPWRASRGLTIPPQESSSSPVGAVSGCSDIAPTGLRMSLDRHAVPWLARHGLDDHATPWLNTLRGPAPLSKAHDTGFAGILQVILRPIRWRRKRKGGLYIDILRAIRHSHGILIFQDQTEL